MFYALSWFVVLALFAMWSLGAWALHAFAVWSAANVGTLGGHAKVIENLNLPAWLAPWVPSEVFSAVKAMTVAVLPAVESVLALAPALGGWLSVAIWLLWGVGSVMLLLSGVALHLVIAMLSRRTDGANRT